MPECKICKHKGINTHICDECASYYSMYEKKIVTNADRIRSMTDEELGKAMFNFILNAASNPDFIMSPQGYTDWLQSEAE